MKPTSPLLDHLRALMRDAADRSGQGFVVDDHVSVEGHFLTVATTATADTPSSMYAVVDAVDVFADPFDDLVRDRARNVAARLLAPYIIITSLRTVVVYRTDAVTKRLPIEEQIVLQVRGLDITSPGQVMVAAHRVAMTETLRGTLVGHGWDTGGVFTGRVVILLSEIMASTDGSAQSRKANEHLATAIVSYVFLQIHHSETLDPMTLPYGARSPQLMMDVIGAYLRDARRAGHTMFPEELETPTMAPHREPLFRMAVHGLVTFLRDVDVSRMSDDERDRAVDAILQWCLGIHATPVPTLDAIDLAIVASGIADRTDDAPLRVLEIGSTMGTFGIRASLATKNVDARVYAADADEQRMILLRATGQRDDNASVRMILRHDEIDHDWDVVCLSLTAITERRRLSLLLHQLRMAPQAPFILFVPLAVLRDREYAEVRQHIVERFDVQWVFTSDDDPLALPDNGTCCIIARLRDGEGASTPSNFTFIRRSLRGVIPDAASIRTLTDERIEAWHVFLRYLTTSERGKVNPEVVVRRIDRSVMLMRTWNTDTGWDDLLIPPDVVASILRKLSPKLRPLRTIATVSGGLRTGANEIFAPHLDEIVGEEIEERFWQHQRDDGTMFDNIVITSTDELTSIAGIPNADRRLLIADSSRSDLAGTNMLTRLERAERDGIHARSTLRHRDPWWDLGTLVTPHLLIPRDQHQRWLVGVNTAHAFSTDACIEIVLDVPEHAQPLAIWMNSSVGLFLSELVQRSAHATDVTARDVQEFPVPTDDILQQLDAKRFREFLYRPIRSIAEEFGTNDADVVRPHTVKKDRRRLDAFIMSDLFALTDEEQRWIYRFALAWRHANSNIRHLAAALATEAEVRYKLRPMREWYSTRIEQLPQGASRTIIMPVQITRAEASQSMFTSQVTLFRNSKREDVIECASAEEAELIALLVNLGKRSIDLPTDVLLIREVLPLVHTFAADLDRITSELLTIIPEDLREQVGAEMREVLRS